MYIILLEFTRIVLTFFFIIICIYWIPVDVGFEAIKLGWKEYMQQPVLPASLAYVLLCFNVVLGPGSLMTAFLTQRGIYSSLRAIFITA